VKEGVPVGQRYGLEIRGAAATDAPGLAALLADLGAGSVPPPVLAARLDAMAKAGGTILIALEWGPPSGVVALQAVTDLAASHPAGLLTTLGVAPDARRRGIGRLLIKAASRSARLAGCDRLLLPAAGRSPDLAAFAAATGFTPEDGFLVRPLLRRGSAPE
jgi:aminoglycoside 6'-N-acetyltransferase I